MPLPIELNFYRYEFKYLLNYDQYRKISRFLKKKGLIPDSYSQHFPGGNYYIASLYLDTPNYQFYWQKQAGIEKRIKYRLRTYSSHGQINTPVFWEIKRKFGDKVEKTRLQFTWQETKQFLTSKTNFNHLAANHNQSDNLAKFYFNSKRYCLQPVVLISYWRQPWLDPLYPHYANFRLTFDHDIEAAQTDDLFCSVRQSPVLADKIIMELKFNGPVPGYINQVIKFFNLTRQALSKYCLGLESCGIVSQEPTKYESTFYLNWHQS